MEVPQKFAQNWHRLLFDADMEHTWRLMTEDFRRVVSQVALGEARKRDESVDAVVGAFSSASPAREDLQEFFGAVQRILENACGVAPDQVGPGVSTRVEAPAYEVVRLYVLDDLAIDAVGRHYLPPGASANALTLIMTAEEPGSWRMAGVGCVMSPGWPPAMSWQPPSEV